MKEIDQEKKTDNISAQNVTDKGGNFLRRSFRNEGGSWEKTEKIVKEIHTYSKVVDELAVDFVKADKKLRELLLQAYQSAPVVESLFYDSPISPNKQTTHLKLYLKKLGWDGVRDVFMNEMDIKPFLKNMQEATRWLLKFKENEKA